MRKILSLLLTLTLLASSVVPTYANTPQEVLFETLKNTVTQATTEAYGENFLKTYDTTFKNLLSTFATNGKVTFYASTQRNYRETNFVSLGADNLSVTYNDDGSSFLLTLTNYDTLAVLDSTTVNNNENKISSFSIYVDDTKFMVEEYNYLSDEADRIIYNFGDSLKGTYFDPDELGFDINLLNYTNIKHFINTILTLESSGTLDKIYYDYFNNFLTYLAKADITYENNTVTLIVDDVLFKEYLVQLESKLREDKNLKEIYESLHLDYDYEDIIEFLVYRAFHSDNIEEALSSVPEDLEYKYVGEISNNVFVKNSFTAYYDEEIIYSYNIEFKDVPNGLLSDVEVNNLDIYEDETNIVFSLKNNMGKRVFNSKVTINDELRTENSFTYTLDGLNINSNGESLAYRTPYFFYDELPVKFQLSYDDWYAEQLSFYENRVTNFTNKISFADKQIAILEKAVRNNTPTVNLDVTSEDDKILLKQYSFYEVNDSYVSNQDTEPYVDYKTGEVLNKQKALTTFKAYKENLNLNLNNILKEKQEFNNTAKDEYKLYCDEREERYQENLLAYNRYLDYVAAGKPKDVRKTSGEFNTSLTNDSFTNISKENTYLNDILKTTSTTAFVFEKSNVKNTINTEGAIPLAEY